VRESRTLSREIDATLIPMGDTLVLPQGATIYLTQALGGSFTAMTERGQIVRIEGVDADAIGETVPESAATAASDRSLSDRVWDQLKTVYDPEIPVNIVDLGLVYACAVETLPEGGHRVAIDFTLTSPACPLSPMLQEDIRRKVLAIDGVREADVRVVFEPLWGSHLMSDAARLQLGLM
jgi:probable FeS assembly SUF system protein SufT